MSNYYVPVEGHTTENLAYYDILTNGYVGKLSNKHLLLLQEVRNNVGLLQARRSWDRLTNAKKALIQALSDDISTSDRSLLIREALDDITHIAADHVVTHVGEFI